MLKQSLKLMILDVSLISTIFKLLDNISESLYPNYMVSVSLILSPAAQVLFQLSTIITEVTLVEAGVDKGENVLLEGY